MGWADRFRRKTKTEQVLIVVLAGSKTVHATICQLASECDRFSALSSHPYTLDFRILTASPQERARNEACGMALSVLKDPNDTLVMIDDDMITHGWRTLKVLDAPDYDIAAPLQYAWFPKGYKEGKLPQAVPCAFMAVGDDGQVSAYPDGKSPQAVVDRVGSGFIAIKRRVLADERMLLATGYNPPALWRNVYAPNFVRVKGLDVDFCDRARALGYRIVVDWSAEVGHAKSADANDIDLYAKTQFKAGYEIGVRDGIQMVESGSGSIGGEGGIPGSEQRGHRPMVVAGMDRTGDD